MKFKPGQSGNPGGGKGIKKDQKKRLASDLLSPFAKDAVAVIADMLKSSEASDQQWAAGMVFSYVFGKPGQVVELSAKGDSPMTAVLMIGNKPTD